jgi:hypothetical protein
LNSGYGLNLFAIPFETVVRKQGAERGLLGLRD